LVLLDLLPPRGQGSAVGWLFGTPGGLLTLAGIAAVLVGIAIWRRR
jgi:hypothetical protein